MLSTLTPEPNVLIHIKIQCSVIGKIDTIYMYTKNMTIICLLFVGIE